MPPMTEQIWNYEQESVAGFTRNPLVCTVARNLRQNLGPKAVPMAHQAIERMRTLSDEVGLKLWLAIHARMVEEESALHPAGVAVH